MSRREAFAVSGRVELDIDSRAGSIEVRTGIVGRVDMRIDGNEEAFSVEQLGDVITIQPVATWSWRSRSTRIYVEVPTGSDVAVRAASADVTLAATLGLARVRTSSGEVRVDAVDQLDVNTASGTVRARSVAADGSCSTASGDVDLGDFGGRLVVSTASGDVRVGRASGPAEIGTASGDVRIERYDGTDVAVSASPVTSRWGCRRGSASSPTSPP
jgi:DUF4097 and DUF4098 domain-containing protein YvlB